MKEPFEIVFNDEYIVVVNKVAKLLVHPSPKKEKNTLTSLLGEKLGENVFPCHRLDRETTGLVVFAKNKKIRSALFAQFKNREIKKRYYALVRGRMKKSKGVLSGKILDLQGQQFGEKAKYAKTVYKTRSTGSRFSLLDLEPLTGRTNQLRIQLAEAGNPILGERSYALGRDFPVKFRRLALHAYYINFRHPLSGDRVEIKVDLAEDMAEFLKQSKANSG